MQSFKTAEYERMGVKLRAVRVEATHHLKFWVVDGEGKKLYPPYLVSRGKKDAPAFVTEKVRKALFLSLEEFRVLIGCRMGREEYLLLRRNRDPSSGA